LWTSLFPNGNFVVLSSPASPLLLNQVGSVRDCLLNQIHHVGFRLVNVSRRVYHVLAEVRLHRRNVERGQAGIDALDFMANLRLQNLRWQRCPQYDA
jgi:hypothetical protein